VAIQSVDRPGWKILWHSSRACSGGAAARPTGSEEEPEQAGRALDVWRLRAGSSGGASANPRRRRKARPTAGPRNGYGSPVGARGGHRGGAAYPVVPPSGRGVSAMKRPAGSDASRSRPAAQLHTGHRAEAMLRQQSDRVHSPICRRCGASFALPIDVVVSSRLM
jgi:hypothetical protein